MIERVVECCDVPLARVIEADSPVVAVALHAGHAVRPSLIPYLAVTDDDRLREEDPYTASIAPAGVSVVEVLRSRFEVDLNRPRSRCVYQGPGDAWGFRVWGSELPDEEDGISRAVHDSFYAALSELLAHTVEQHRRFVVLDLHSYNHRREGADAPPADGATHPEVNLGTGRFDRERWAPVVRAFTTTMKCEGFDVRENVKFRGGHLSQWVSESFGEAGCALAIEFKKTYMDEWTGVPDLPSIARIRRALGSTLAPLAEALGTVG